MEPWKSRQPPAGHRAAVRRQDCNEPQQPVSSHPDLRSPAMARYDANYIPVAAMTIFAHPADAELTVSGTLAKWSKAGCRVTLVTCTYGQVGTHDPAFTRESLAMTRAAEQH